jgi:hypothetical protein
MIDVVLHQLQREGSRAVSGFMKPEGVVIYLVASRQLYKCTIDNDDEPKGQNNENNNYS